MTRDEWQRIKTITAAALALRGADRDSYLDEECGGNAQLRREVVSLLASTAAAADLFETPVQATRRALAALMGTPASRIGDHIGPYRVLSELGRGGMGTAYLAERDDGAYRKQVAIKVIKRGMDTDAIVRRFLHERQILAGLNHPNIAMLLDGGTTADGVPYFVMEYVAGQPIDAFCDARQLPIPARLELVRAVCGAVDHAHACRVIHRDLKPANILVTADGVPKLLDFGIAKLLDPEPGQQTEGTLLGQAMTPQYASPEQVRGLPITHASDVYAIGLLTYELLTGRPPYRVTGRPPLEAGRLVCDTTPPPPSGVVDTEAARGRGLSLTALRRQLAGPLDTIVMTALRKEPDRRYPTPRALADDIGRYLEGRPVSARPAGLASRLAATLRTPRARLGGVALALLVLSIGAGFQRFGRARPAAHPIAVVAVLPWSGDPSVADAEYLLDGITEGVIRQLSRSPAIRVISRDSAYRYKGKPVDLSAVARELGADAVLTGRAEAADAGVALAVEFVHASDGRRFWQQHYRPTMGEAQAIQRDLAQRVADTVAPVTAQTLRTTSPADAPRHPEAYALYLRGRYFWNKRTVSTLQKSIEYFRKAVEADPTFALAYSGLADSYSLLTEFHGAPATETYGAALRAALRALEIDNGLAEAHTSLAYIRQFYEWDWAGAEIEFRRALELDPRYATAHQWHAEFLSAMGRHEDALRSIRSALTQDPVSLIVNAVEANLLYMARRYDDAIAQAREAIELDPNFPEAYEFLKRALDQKGLYAEAITVRQQRRVLLGLDVSETRALRLARSTSDRRTYWRHRAEQELTEGRTEGLQRFEMAELEGQAGNVSRALDWLGRACDEHDFMMMYVHAIPTIDPLRGDERYRALVQRGCRVPPADR